MGDTVGSDVCLVGHEDDVVEIVQEVDDILNAVSGRILRVGVAYVAHQRTYNGGSGSVYREIYRRGG